jgi:nitrite reductase/ring-hydroxylating ferredoxin subunit
LKRLLFYFFVIQFCWSCGRDTYDQPIPPAFFQDIVIDITFPEYVRLRTDGGTYEMNDKGIRGIIIYRKSSGNYLAYEKNCSYHPADACATVQVDASGLYMIDFCCGSSFSLQDGTPIGGPAWRPLRQYRTIMDIALLTITSESLNGM